jgi:hypothetical protein
MRSILKIANAAYKLAEGLCLTGQTRLVWEPTCYNVLSMHLIWSTSIRRG